MIAFTIVCITDTQTMDAPQKLDVANISTIRRGENKKEIWYSADLFPVDGFKIMVAHKCKIDIEERKAGDIKCWKERPWHYEPISDEYFDFLEKEYEQRKNK